MIREFIFWLCLMTVLFVPLTAAIGMPNPLLAAVLLALIPAAAVPGESRHG